MWIFWSRDSGGERWMIRGVFSFCLYAMSLFRPIFILKWNSLCIIDAQAR